MELDKHPNEREAERGLTDGSRRGPQPWFAKRERETGGKQEEMRVGV